MRDGEPFVFRVFLPETPGFLRTWREVSSVARWDRHWLVPGGHALVLSGGERVELARMRTVNGFRVEETVLSAAFPLDWMSVRLVGDVLPKGLRQANLDGRSAQRFVDTLAFDTLPQASVFKQAVTAYSGAICAVVTEVSVPEWQAATVSVAFESHSADALRSFLSAARIGTMQHRDLSDWLRDAHLAATPERRASEARRLSRAG